MNQPNAPVAARLALCATVLGLAPIAGQGLCLSKAAAPTLGSTWSVAFAGATSQSVLFLPSVTAGPIPLSVINPSDSRSLAVGAELSAAWQVQSVGGGSGTFGLPLPADTSLTGVDLRGQAVTLPGNPFLVDQISNVVVARLGQADRSQRLGSQLVVARALGVTAAAGNGCAADRLLTLGGGSGSLTSATGLDSSELFDAANLSVVAGPRMASARALPLAISLGGSRTLVIGGVDANGVAQSSCEIYDASTNTFSSTGSMRSPRAGHFGTRLSNGQILVAGGTTTLADPVQALANTQNSAEIYDPATGTWRAARSMPRRLLLGSIDALPNGRALLSGGFEVQVIFGIPLPRGTVRSCSIYNASNNSWGGAPSMGADRSGHGINSVTLPNGDILMTGGGTSGADLTQARPISGVEVFRVATNSWQAAPAMVTPRLGHTATLLSNGSVLVAGGAIGTISAPQGIRSVQLYTPSSNSWRTLPDLIDARVGHTAYQTAAGTVVLFGGQASTTTTLRSVEQISF